MAVDEMTPVNAIEEVLARASELEAAEKGRPLEEAVLSTEEMESFHEEIERVAEAHLLDDESDRQLLLR